MVLFLFTLSFLVSQQEVAPTMSSVVTILNVFLTTTDVMTIMTVEIIVMKRDVVWFNAVWFNAY